MDRADAQRVSIDASTCPVLALTHLASCNFTRPAATVVRVVADPA